MVHNNIKYEDTKNNKPLTLPFDLLAKAVFRIMLRIRHKTNPRDARYRYVFPSTRADSKKKHLQDPRKTFKKICELAKVKLKCIHFLRHTWATITYEALNDLEAVL